MQPSVWLDQATNQLLRLDEELRALLRHGRDNYQPGKYGQIKTAAVSTGYGPDCITLTRHQVRTLLRGAVPPIPPHRTLRAHHARLHIQLQRFLDRLPALSADSTDSEARASGAALLEALRSWLAEMQWHAATREAGIRWRRGHQAGDQERAISALTRLQTDKEGTDPPDPRQLSLPLAAAA